MGEVCTYVGQTKRSLATRVKEHQKAAFNGNRETSTLAKHVMDTGHAIDWEGSCILDMCASLRSRLFLESWYIQKEQHPLNRELGPLPTQYYTLSR